MLHLGHLFETKFINSFKEYRMAMQVKDPRRGRPGALVEGLVKSPDRVRGKMSLSPRTPKTGQVRFFSRFLLVTVLICLGSIVWLSQTSTLVSLGYDIARMEKQKAELDTAAQRLQSQIADYESLSRIEDEAKSKLGMVPASKTIYIEMPPNQTETSPSAGANPNLAPTTDWWKDLVEILPQQPKNTPTATPGK